MAASDDRLARWRARYPALQALESRARQRIPYFAADFLDGGTGDELSRRRNLDGLARIEIVPRYGVDLSSVDTACTLFGRSYSAPIVIAPVGMDGAIWPGATRHFAETAHDTGLAYMTGTLASASLESVAETAPDQAWFQLYTMPGEDHRVSFDMLRRAEAAGVHAVAVTLDVPVAPRRIRDMRNRVASPLRLTPGLIAATLTRPAWLSAYSREGMPRFANVAPYCREGATKEELDAFVAGSRPGSGATWDVIARFRDAWPRALMIKGVLHPADAEKAAELGLDGVIVSNHGGRQFDAAPAAIDVVPAIRAALGPDKTVLMDGGIMSGLDVLKAIACGADGVLAGRAFMLGLAALGDDGARHVAATLADELRIALAQTGACTVAGARKLAVRHRDAWRAQDFERSLAAMPATNE